MSLQARIAIRYRDTYKLVRAYSCRETGVCVGEFAQRDGPLHISFGTERSSGPWLSVWTSPS